MVSLFAAVLTENPYISFLVAVTAALWLFNCLVPFFATSSRQIFAMAFDRFLPEKFAEVNERFHSPHWSLLFCLILTVLSTLMCIYITGVWTLAESLMVFFTFTYLLTAISGTILPYVRPDLFERGARLLIKGFPAISILGVIATFWWFFGFLLSCLGMSTITCVFVATVYGIGFLIYIAYLAYNIRRGVDIKTIYAELPPV
jgi:amino acid transporter